MAFTDRLHNRGSISTGYDIANSLKVEPDNGERFETVNTFTNYSSVRKFTVSAWLKRTELTVQSLIWFNSNTATSVQLEFGSDDKLGFLLQDNVGNGVESYAKTSALFRDTSAWYHVILAVDTTQGTAANRTKIYVNGVNQTLEQGNGSYDTFPAQNYDCPLQTRHYLLGYDGGNNGFRGYAAEYYFLDGITASPTDLGEFDEDSGIWKPIEYTGDFGNEGYYLDFEDASALGKDVSSNNQGNFTHYGGSAADQATDTPTNNFCTLTSAWAYAATATLTDGGTHVVGPSANWAGSKATMGVSRGKWYWEVRFTDTLAYTGLQTDGESNIGASGNPAQSNNTSISITGASKYRTYINGTDSVFTSQPSGNIGASELCGFALDLDSGTKTLKLLRSGSVVQTYTLTDSLATQEVFPYVSVYQNYILYLNFGGFYNYTFSSPESDANGYGTFEYAPPSGYYALCTKNLAEYG